MRRLALLATTLVWLAVTLPRPVFGAQWGSPYGDPAGFCPAQSFLPSTYTTIVSNDPLVGSNPEQDTFWGIHPYPGYDDWYGSWYGDFRGAPGDASGWRHIGTSLYGRPPLHWNFGDWGWAVHGHAKQYIAYYNWTFGGYCGLGRYAGAGPPPYMADVFGNPVVDIYVDSVPPYPPQPRAVAATTGSVTFTWDPVADRGDGAGADYWAAGMDHYTSWLTAAGGRPEQQADTGSPRTLTARGLAPGETACVHVRAVDALGNATPDQQACARPIAPPPPPPAPAAAAIRANPWPAGLAGLDSWFWLSPTPAAFTVNEVAAGWQYRITAVPAGVSWSFGDGVSASLPAPSGLGLAYPQPSPVAHAYQAHSEAGYLVSATVHWALSWQALSGGQWLGPYSMPGLDAVSGPLSYPVRQAQTEVTAVS